MLNIFRRKRDDDVLKELNRSLSRVDKDIYLIQQWISHLHDRSEEIKDSHFQHVELTRRDIGEINRWIKYLHAHNSEMHRFVKETTKNILELRKNHEEVMKRVENIEKGQVGTIERTIRGQLKDMSGERGGRAEVPIVVEKERVADKGEFTGSQIELLNVLYHADRPLGYGELAKSVGKKEKSIRNLIYELRSKEVKIKSRPVGIRKKGFFLEREEKIRISGR
jgi:hypothetical protein